jgi:hypothetical protein
MAGYLGLPRRPSLDPAKRINDAALDAGVDRAEQLEADVLCILCITVLRDGRAATSEMGLDGYAAQVAILEQALQAARQLAEEEAE